MGGFPPPLVTVDDVSDAQRDGHDHGGHWRRWLWWGPWSRWSPRLLRDDDGLGQGGSHGCAGLTAGLVTITTTATADDDELDHSGC